MNREQKLERALLVIEGVTLEHADLENELASNIYTIAHGALGIGSCASHCPHVINHNEIANKYVDGLKLSRIIDIRKIQGN